MKFNKLLSCLSVTAALAVSGNAMANTPWIWSGTVASWETQVVVFDAESDMAFIAPSPILGGGLAGLDSLINVRITEVQINSADYYTVAYDLPVAGYAGGPATFNYYVASLTSEGISGFRLDTTVTDSVEVVSAHVTSVYGLDITLISNAGNQVGPYNFPAQPSVQVEDTLNPNGSFIQHVDNVITTSVPEPEIVVMYGIGLVGLLLNGKRRKA